MSTIPPNPADDPTERDNPPPEEMTLRDGDTVSFTAPTDGTTNIVVNVVPPERSTGFVGSCLQGCGCLIVIIVVLGALGSLGR